MWIGLIISRSIFFKFFLQNSVSISNLSKFMNLSFKSASYIRRCNVCLLFWLCFLPDIIASDTHMCTKCPTTSEVAYPLTQWSPGNSSKAVNKMFCHYSDRGCPQFFFFFHFCTQSQLSLCRLGLFTLCSENEDEVNWKEIFAKWDKKCPGLETA